MEHLDRWEDLIGQIYDAALDPGRWPLVIECATEVLEARRAKMALLNLPALEEFRSVLYRVDPESQVRWIAEFVERDPWTLAMYYLPGSFATTGSAVVPYTELRRSEIYNEFLRPDGVEDILIASLGDGTGGRSFAGFFRDQLFDRRHLRLLDRLAPHLRRAVQTQERLVALHRRVEASEAALDQLRAAVFVLDPAGLVMLCNRKAEAMLREADGLAMRAARLHCVHPDENRKLDGAVRAAAIAVNRRAPVTGATLAVSRPSRRRPLSLLITPVRHREPTLPLLPADARRRAAVLVTVRDLEDIVQPPAEHLASLFGLTPAEARLAAALATRLSVEDYAEQAKITIGTARWTLKRVLEKTGSRRQSELVHLVATSVASLVAD